MLPDHHQPPNNFDHFSDSLSSDLVPCRCIIIIIIAYYSPGSGNSLSTRNMKQTMSDFSPPSPGTRPVLSLSWSPQRWYNCEEELWLTCWLHWTPPESRCRGGCWNTSQSRSPKDTERKQCFPKISHNYSNLTKTVLKWEIELVCFVHGVKAG